jgi:hypothetical protein
MDPRNIQGCRSLVSSGLRLQAVTCSSNSEQASGRILRGRSLLLDPILLQTTDGCMTAPCFWSACSYSSPASAVTWGGRRTVFLFVIVLQTDLLAKAHFTKEKCVIISSSAAISAVHMGQRRCCAAGMALVGPREKEGRVNVELPSMGEQHLIPRHTPSRVQHPNPCYFFLLSLRPSPSQPCALTHHHHHHHCHSIIAFNLMIHRDPR